MTLFLYASCGAWTLAQIFENLIIVLSWNNVLYLCVGQTGCLDAEYLNFSIKILSCIFVHLGESRQASPSGWTRVNFGWVRRLRSLRTKHLFTLVNQDKRPRPGEPGWISDEFGCSGASVLSTCSPWWTRTSFLVRVHPGEHRINLDAPEPPNAFEIQPGLPGRGNLSGFTRVNVLWFGFRLNRPMKYDYPVIMNWLTRNFFSVHFWIAWMSLILGAGWTRPK